MGNDRGQLIAAADHADQAQIDAHIAAGQRKRVDLTVLAQEQRPGKALLQLGRQLATLARRILQMQPDAFHIFLQHRVVQIVRIAVQLADDGIAQTPLLARGQRRCAVAQGRQARRLRRGSQGGYGLNSYQNRSCQRF